MTKVTAKKQENPSKRAHKKMPCKEAKRQSPFDRALQKTSSERAQRNSHYKRANGKVLCERVRGKKTSAKESTYETTANSRNGEKPYKSSGGNPYRSAQRKSWQSAHRRNPYKKMHVRRLRERAQEKSLEESAGENDPA